MACQEYYVWNFWPSTFFPLRKVFPFSWHPNKGTVTTASTCPVFITLENYPPSNDSFMDETTSHGVKNQLLLYLLYINSTYSSNKRVFTVSFYIFISRLHIFLINSSWDLRKMGYNGRGWSALQCDMKEKKLFLQTKKFFFALNLWEALQNRLQRAVFSIIFMVRTGKKSERHFAAETLSL